MAVPIKRMKHSDHVVNFSTPLLPSEQKEMINASFTSLLFNYAGRILDKFPTSCEPELHKEQKGRAFQPEDELCEVFALTFINTFYISNFLARNCKDLINDLTSSVPFFARISIFV